MGAPDVAEPTKPHGISSLSVTGFKSLASVRDLPLRQINLLIGANGAGKSNVLGVFSLLRQVERGRLSDYTAQAGGADRVLSFGRKHTNAIEIALHLSGKKPESYRLALVPTETNRLEIDSGLRIEAQYRRRSARDGSADSRFSLKDWISDFEIHHFHDTGPGSRLKTTSDLHDNRALRADGSNLASVLYYLQQRAVAVYGLIRSTVRLAAPFFDDFELRPNRLNPDTIRLEWRHRQIETYFDVSSLSDGTLRFIALCVLLLQPVDMLPPIIIIDEPELGLHPYAVNLLAALIQKAAVDRQVIVATQSPSLLDHFEPEDVIVADLIDGATRLRRLENKPLQEWLKTYSLGELWEKNELGGTPGEP